MTRLSFRTRVLLYLFLFAVVPSSVLMLGGAAVVSATLPRITGSGAWDSTAASGRRAISALRRAPLTPAQRGALDAHEAELEASLTQARRFSYLASRAVPVVGLLALLGSALLAVLASRVAGHLSRQLSRPLHEIVGWTELIARGVPLPDGPPPRGAPEFETLRNRMRHMARELETARTRELEAGRLEAFRETARRVAHELKNPLTPIRFAVDRLRREVQPPLTDVVEVISSEASRLEEMARGFAQFGRLPDGPVADLDLGELVRYAARATVPPDVPVNIHVNKNVPMLRGHHDALARAVSNVLINAVEACKTGGGVEIHVAPAKVVGQPEEAVELRVRDSGCGIKPAHLARIWEPYVTDKPGGTGLGLAIARQTVLAHGGTVDAVSALGQGTEIRFVLPVRGGPAVLREPTERGE